MTEINKNERQLAYFTMEVALQPDIPTYSGGLGVLAGDTLRSMADLEIPAVAISLSYSTGYFYQVIDPSGYQTEREIRWEFSSEFDKVPVTIQLPLQDKKFFVSAWVYNIIGQTGHIIPVYLLDTNIDSNEPWQRQFTHVLYDATPFQRFVQELILGMGGVKLLEALGYKNIKTYHMNEGHAALLSLQLLGNSHKTESEVEEAWEDIKKRVIFTTHTPVPAGHDKFEYDLFNDVFRDRAPSNIRELAGEKQVNMTVLALNSSRWSNAVSQKHGEVTRDMFPAHPNIDAVTNGVHSAFWTCEPIQLVFDKYLPGWRMKPALLAKALQIDNDDLWRAHQKAKRMLLDYEKSHSWVLLDKKLLTVGFARRVTAYKRHTLLFQDKERLARICKKKVQFIFAGKAHPRDSGGKNTIKQIHDISDHLWESYGVRVVFLENYDMDLSKLMTSGVDIWMNNPIRYMEASGTSGMKAAHNGVLNLSVLDGWWIEGFEFEPLAGWAIGPKPEDPEAQEPANWAKEAGDIYEVLENEAIPIYFHNWQKWTERMKHAIRLGSYFNTHRMVEEYAQRGWRLVRQPRWRYNGR